MERISTVVRAVQQAKFSKTAGNLPGDIETTLNRFPADHPPGRSTSKDFMTGLVQEGNSWSKRNRRFPRFSCLEK